MFCTICGADNKDTAAFCRKCGAATEVEVETRVAARGPAEYRPPRFDGPVQPVEKHTGSTLPDRDDSDDESRRVTEEREIFTISPTLKFVKVGYVLAAVAALFLVALVSAFAGNLVSTSVAVLLGLLLFLIPAYFHLVQKLTDYTLTETALRIDSGLIARTTRSIPLRRIQDVTVTTTIPQRLLGFGDIVIDNASEDAGKVVLDNIDSPRKYADILLKQMSRIER